MKKLIVTLMSLFMLMSLVACSKSNNESESISNNTLNENILFTVHSDASLKVMYPTIDEFNKSSVVDAIVKGTISNIEYSYISGLSYSILTVNVSQSYKGNIEKTIKVYEDGGYVKVKDKLDDLSKHIDTNKLTQEQIENGIVDVTFFNAPHAKKGDQVILYLTKNVNPLPTDTYMITSSLYGKFTLDKQDNNYKRAELDIKENTKSDYEKSTDSNTNNLVNTFENSIPEDAMESKLLNLK